MQESSLCRKQMYLKGSIVNILWSEKHNKVVLNLCSTRAHGKNYLVVPVPFCFPNPLQRLAAIMDIDSEMQLVDTISESSLAAVHLTLKRIIFCPLLGPKAPNLL